MADKIVGVYDIKVDQAVKNLNKLEKEVKDVGTQSKKTAKDTEKSYSGMAKSLTGQFKNLAGAIGLAFSVQQIVSFGKEAVMLAAKVEGIERAFNKLNKPDLLNNLRKATRGTVSDLQLMQQAVRANNFQVPLEKLASFFEFATKRSIETGESVDYLVQSIVDGIGRKSTLVLDNLGISAAQLQEEVKRTGDFGEAAANIIEQSLAQTGDVADTTAIKISQMNVLLENTKVVIGQELIKEADSLADSFGELGDEFDSLFGDTGNIDVFADALSLVFQYGTSGVKALTLLASGVLNILDNVKDGILEIGKNLGLVDEELEEVNETLERGAGLAAGIAAAFDAMTPKDEQIKNLAYYNDLIKELQTEQKAANTTRERVRELEDEINEAMRQRLILLGRLREVGGTTLDPIDPIENTELLQAQEITDDLIDETNYRYDEINKIKQEYREADLAEEKRLAEQKRMLQEQGLDSAVSIVDSLFQIQQNAFIAEEQELQSQLEQGLITREKYEEELNKIKQKQAQSNKDAAIFQATISTAQAVVNALGSYPFLPTNIALAATIGAAGAAQIAAIASQPLPTFAEGGFVNEHGEFVGRKHSQGGVKIEAEGGEFITAAKYAQPNKDILKAINSGSWEKYKVENIIAPAIEQVLEGGLQGLGASYTLNTNWTDRNLLKQGDRLRASNKDGFVYLGKKIESLKGNTSRWN